MRRLEKGAFPMSLDRELAAYRSNLARLLQEQAEGKFVLVHGDEIAGVYPTQDEALHAGYDRFGLDPFLVKRVQETEKPVFVSRGVRPCPS
jgi:hypothetical protein